MMVKALYPILKRIVPSIAFVMSLVFAVFLASPYVVYGVVEWLNSKGGEAFITGVVRTQAHLMGYEVKLSALDIALPEKITVRGLRLSGGNDQDISLNSFEMNFSDGLKGKLTADALLLSSYNMTLTGDFAFNGTTLKLSHIIMRFPEVEISGDGALSPFSMAFNGHMSGEVNDLTPYVDLIGTDHDISSLVFDVDVSSGLGWSDVAIRASAPSYTYLPAGYSVHNLLFSGHVKNAKRIDIESFTVEDGKGGRTKLSGVYSLSTSNIDMNAIANNFTAQINDEMIDILFDANIDLEGRVDALQLAGDILLKQTVITLPERFSNAPSELNIIQNKQHETGRHAGKNIALDLELKAPEKVFVRGWGLDAEFGGALDIRGNAQTPELYGDLSILRGEFSEFGKNFTLPVARFSFAGPVPPSPSVDILAEHDTGDVIGKIRISGIATDPDIALSAEPPLPEDEVLSRILFGKSMDNLSPFQIVQLTRTLAKFSGAGGQASSFDPLGTVRQGIGLDELHVGVDESGEVNIDAGKYIADGVYLELEGGSGEDSGSASVEIELTPNITLESEIGQDARGGAGIFWEWDY